MNLKKMKRLLLEQKTLNFKLENGVQVPKHFHVTELGLVSKDFIDCGGVRRFTKAVNFQLWTANDYEHRLKPLNLLEIIKKSEKVLEIDENLDIEVEYQTDSISKFDLDLEGDSFILKAKKTNCLAPDSCNPSPKPRLSLSDLVLTNNCSGENNCC